MTLAEMARLLNLNQPSGDDVPVSGLAYNSRAVRPGDVFVCIRGLKEDGADYAQEALRNGAVGLIIDREVPLPEAPTLRVPNARQALAHLSAELCGRPADQMLVLGVTGTTGKTTTTHFCEAVLKAKGLNPGLVGSIHAKVGDTTRLLANPTPESLELHHLLADMRGVGHDSVVMEVTSHALALDRVHGMHFDMAIFTNLSRNHLDFHGDLESYFNSKMRLFLNLGTRERRLCPPFAVLNLDNAYTRRIVPRLRVPHITYGLHPDAMVRAEDIQASPHGVSFRAVTPVGQKRIHLKLSGLFNVPNALAAIATGLAQRIELEDTLKAVESVTGVRGRFELIREGQDFTTVVDYASTPDGLRQLLESARPLTEGRVILVFGCPGERDRGKRAVMGEIAGQGADVVILTSDNPRSESPASIMADIRRGGVGTAASWEAELDRGLAISRAVAMANPGDMILIAGKGHESQQILRDGPVDFDDVEVARQAVRLRLNKAGRRDRRNASPALWTEHRRHSGEMPALRDNPR